MNESLKSGHFWIEMVSIFLRFWWNDIYLFYLYVNDLA